MEVDFCVETLNEAIARFGPPEIMNTDQGSQFTSSAWTDRLCASQWMAKGGSSTTSSWNGSGGA